MTSTAGATSPNVSVMDKVSGSVDIIVGKMTGNESKIQEGREKKLGDTSLVDDTNNPTGTNPNPNLNPGNSMHTNNDNSYNYDGERAGCERVETDETADRYQHGNYTGPNLTAPPPLHYSPSNDHDHDHDHTQYHDHDQRDHSGTRLEEEDDQYVEIHEHEQGAGGGAGYDLHGGLPTGAPSPLPSGRGRGAGVFDPFDRAGADNGIARGRGGIQL